MAEELKHLLDQIQKEGVDKANQEAKEILSQAKEKAAAIISEAETKAEQTLKKAETDARSFADRSAKTLEQTARDLLITVGQGCEKVVSAMLAKTVDQSLDKELLEKMILELLKQYDGKITTIQLSQADKDSLVGFCTAQAAESGKSIELQSDTEILKGFKLAFKDSNVYLDYTSEAVSESLSAMLRPELARVVSAVSRDHMNESA